MSTITLTCAYDGHEWQRESKRGRRPAYCPEHSGSGADHEEVPQTRTIDTLLQQAYAALERTGEQEEDVRKVLYCAGQIESGRKDDMSVIELCLKDIIRKANR